MANEHIIRNGYLKVKSFVIVRWQRAELDNIGRKVKTKLYFVVVLRSVKSQLKELKINCIKENDSYIQEN